MDIYELIKGRRSIRSYKQEPVEKEKLDRILDAARFAPSAANMQPLHFVVVQNAEIKQQLKTTYNAEWFYTAPIIICVCSIPEKSWKRSDGKNYADIDATIAMDHLILAASAEGLGTCWIAAFKVPQLKTILKLPYGVEPVAMTPLGYPQTIPEPTYRKPIEEIVTYLS